MLWGHWLWLRKALSHSDTCHHSPARTCLQLYTPNAFCQVGVAFHGSALSRTVCLILTNPSGVALRFLCFPPSSSLPWAAFLLPSPPAASLFPSTSPPPCEEAWSWLLHFTPIYSQVCVAFTWCFLLWRWQQTESLNKFGFRCFNEKLTRLILASPSKEEH